MTSSYHYAQIRTRKRGEPTLHPAVGWPVSVGTYPEFQVHNAQKQYDAIVLGDDGIVYKELVMKECGSRTFHKEIVYVEKSEGDWFDLTPCTPCNPSPEKPLSFKDTPQAFQNWWGANSEVIGEVFWSAFEAGRQLGTKDYHSIRGPGYGD